MSATGSVMTMCAPPSPRRLGDAGNLPCVRQLAETDAAQHEPAEHGPLPSAPLAARVRAHTELRAPPLLVQQCFLRHRLVLVLTRSPTPRPCPRRGTPARAGAPGLRRRLAPSSRS